MSLFWTGKEDYKKYPYRSTDELFRHLIVIPNPFKKTFDEDGDALYPYLAVVVAPWWFCRYIFKKEHRDDAKYWRWMDRCDKEADRIMEVIFPDWWETIQKYLGHELDVDDPLVDWAYDMKEEIFKQVQEANPRG